MGPRSLIAVLLLLTPPAQAESFQSWSARAAREEREKDDQAAIVSYSNALSLWKTSDGKPSKAKALCARAALRERGGDDENALRDYAECLSIDKKNPRAFHRRGRLRLKAGKIPAAIDDFYRAIALDIGFGQAYADRARAYEMQGELGFAREDYRHACALKVKAACARAKGGPQPLVEEGDLEPARPPSKTRRMPRFQDCLGALQACVDRGGGFGGCVGKAPTCERDPRKGCCPDACLTAYRRLLNNGASEARAYREIFTPKASCTIPLPDENGGD